MSHTNTETINSTEINNSGPFRVGDDLTSGTAGQVLKSQGPDLPPEWGTDTDTTYQGSSTINIDTTTDPDTINCLKVPNTLTFTGTATGTYDGSSAVSINLTDSDNQLNLTAALPVVINNGGGLNREVELQYDSNTLGAGGGALEVLKVPNTLTFTGTATGTYDGSSALSINLTDTDTTYQGSSTININTSTIPDTINCLKVPNVMTASTNIIFTNTDDGAAATNYDGSQPITIRATDTDTTYQGGTNISIDTSTTPDSINLDVSIMNQTLLLFNQTGITTAIIGSAYPNKPSVATYFDLSSALNITSPYCFHKIYDSASTDFDSLTTSYAAGSILGALGASIVAKQTALCVEVIVYNYAISSNRDTDMRLVDKGGSEWSVGISEGGAGTGTIQTAREVHRADETDRQIVHQTWSITGLTLGSTYTFNPQARTSATSNFLAAGGNYPSAFFRGYYLPS